jgi:hypothetical protein
MRNRHAFIIAAPVFAAALFAGTTSAHAAGPQQVSYVRADDAGIDAWLVDWKTTPHAAHVSDLIGSADGTFTYDGTQRLVTLDTPISVTIPAVDCNGLPMSQLVAINQVVFRKVSGGALEGMAQVVEIGNIIDIDGCTPGLVTPFGSPTDPGVDTDFLDMTQRAPITDLVPGTSIAGMSEDAFDPVTGVLTERVQVTTFKTGRVTFDSTLHTYDTNNNDGWIVVDYGAFRRGYTRLTQDTQSGKEVWLSAEWSDGQPTQVSRQLMAKPRFPAGFGGRTSASHDWQSGLFAETDTPVHFLLFHDLTGEFDQYQPDGSKITQDVRWNLQDPNIQIRRGDPAAVAYKRTWQPIGNYGSNHWVLETEDTYTDKVLTGTRITTRVNFYIDEGPAMPPAAQAPKATAAGAAGEGMAHTPQR